MQPDPQTVTSAYDSLVQSGPLGAALAIVLLSSIALVFWLVKTMYATLREKDEQIKEIQERRVEGATMAIKAITENSRISDKLLKAIEKQTQTREGR